MSPRWQNLVQAIRKLPGVGPKMAERLAIHLMKSPDTEQILRAIQDAKTHLRNCVLCGSYTEENICARCNDQRRDRHVVCVVEEIADLEAVERAGVFRGAYHLLGGVLSPLDGIGPRQLRIEPLMKRLENSDPNIDEVILATNPTVEGEATATYLAQLIHPLGKRVTRLAYGLPSGVSIEYADELTLARALEGRQSI
ncbi:MAG: recombination protein RecR [Bdellovibrionales bacterium]|nr:recombination protein RecR [Bdellovibrionales bacterium]